MPTPAQTTLVLGATGATGRLLVAQLLDRGHTVRAVVRKPDSLPGELRGHDPDRLQLIQAAVNDLTGVQMQEHIRGCHAVASCLGHNLTLRGILGPPYRLVTHATRRACEAIVRNATQQTAPPGLDSAEPNAAPPVRVVLMNTTGNRHRGLHEPVSIAQKAVLFALRWLLPPHADNEQAAEYLRTQIGPDHTAVQWAAVRPDGLTNANDVTPYDLHPSPTRSAIFNAGKTSRINVAHFMAQLMTDDETWARWQNQMPVIYNRE